jgi:hypothetical protein
MNDPLKDCSQQWFLGKKFDSFSLGLVKCLIGANSLYILT